MPAGTSLQRDGDGEEGKLVVVCEQGALFGLGNMDYRKQVLQGFHPEPVKDEQKIWSAQSRSSPEQLQSLATFGIWKCTQTSRSAALHKHSHAVLTWYSTAASKKSNQDHRGTSRLLIATWHPICKITQITSGFQFRLF